jgi:hypothetical protein
LNRPSNKVIACNVGDFHLVATAKFLNGGSVVEDDLAIYFRRLPTMPSDQKEF